MNSILYLHESEGERDELRKSTFKLRFAFMLWTHRDAFISAAFHVVQAAPAFFCYHLFYLLHDNRMRLRSLNVYVNVEKVFSQRNADASGFAGKRFNARFQIAILLYRWNAIEKIGISY